jgi:RimJ/RimL family protein N-acetyltransferase
MKSETPVTRTIGPFVDPLPPGTLPDLRKIEGRYVTLEALNPAEHGPDLWNAIKGDDEVWDYLFSGPFADEASFIDWLASSAAKRDPWFYAYVVDGKALGMGSFMRADPAHGVIEIGNILISPALQKTRSSTEATYLFMQHAFESLGCRRFEWKCNALNAPSIVSAKRFGFTFEGIFRQHMIVKGRNRDTAWFSIIDDEWPRIKAGFERWLDPTNFDAHGKQKAKLKFSN